MKYLKLIFFLFLYSFTEGQDVVDLIDEYTASYVSKGDFSGCILVTDKGQIRYENCFGFSNHAFQVLNQTKTKFKIGSISKQFTATAILIMEQEGLLKTTDTISKFFPYNSHANQITIQQLLTHTSGITDIYNIPDFNTLSCQKKNIADLTKLLLTAELDFKPGLQYQYSNGGYAILAQIIEAVSGKTYQMYLKEKIFNPLKMNATGHAREHEIISNLAIGYDPYGYNEVKNHRFPGA